ncbi:alpha/beta hydrolase family protein [Streptomyces paromomycinus]|uniref:Lipase n=1 Tax=Streptomyces paromomycinus TaxID=92743 RepID=A0A401WEQ9_STREY|nr:alpha/beta hydrolase [Streptomyces paromomycinus]GCD47778.1 lipase [Streptomyces paromomycinus]
MIRLFRAAGTAALSLLLGLPLLPQPLAAAADTSWAAPPSATNSADGTDRTGPKAAARLRLPAPTGPYAVGRSTLPLTDHSRPDPWVPTATSRELMVGLHYPARRGTGASARYATVEESRHLIKAMGWENMVTPEALSAMAVHSRTDARPASGRYPLLVVSPGFSAPGFSLTSLAEDLASRGYVVATVDHAYESTGTAFPGGRVLTCAACDQVYGTEDGFRRAAVGRGQDVSFVLDRLTAHGSAWRYSHLIDEKRIGMAGHSLGGASAVSAMARDSRIRAGVNMDGAFQDPVPAGGLGSRPFLMLGTDNEVHRPGGRDRTWDLAWSRLDGWKRWLTVAGADHLTFSDAPVIADALTPPATNTTAPAAPTDPTAPTPSQPPLSGQRSVALTRTYVAAFFDQHLRHIPQRLLQGPTKDNPEVTFHSPAPASPAAG